MKLCSLSDILSYVYFVSAGDIQMRSDTAVAPVFRCRSLHYHSAQRPADVGWLKIRDLSDQDSSQVNVLLSLLQHHHLHYRLTKLQIRHPLAPSIFPWLCNAVPRSLHRYFEVSMVACLQDLLTCAPRLQSGPVLQHQQPLGPPSTYKYSRSNPSLHSPTLTWESSFLVRYYSYSTLHYSPLGSHFSSPRRINAGSLSCSWLSPIVDLGHGIAGLRCHP
jgi:hypothetical protein